MAEVHNLLKKAASLEVSPELDGYSKVVIFTGAQDENGNDIVYEAGDDSGRTLEIRNEFAAPEMARNILNRIRGWKYQPYEAKGAMLDPSAELGDGVNINGVYSGVYLRATNFSPMMAADISAPTDTEIEHELTSNTPTDRTYSRFVRSTRAMLTLTATQIAAKVERKSESGDHAFGWNLTADGWTIWAENESNEIIKATKNGLTVKGKIEADEGHIGGENGFTIKAGKLYSNMPSMSSKNSQGVYIGTDGIKLGSGFQVDSGGNLKATSGKFGSLSVDGSGKTIGSYGGNLSGCGGSVSGLTGSISSGINVGNQSLNSYVTGVVGSYLDTGRLKKLSVSDEIFFQGYKLKLGSVDGKSVVIWE